MFSNFNDFRLEVSKYLYAENGHFKSTVVIGQFFIHVRSFKIQSSGIPSVSYFPFIISDIFKTA